MADGITNVLTHPNSPRARMPRRSGARSGRLKTPSGPGVIPDRSRHEESFGRRGRGHSQGRNRNQDEIAVADAHPLGAHPWVRADYIAKFRSLADEIVPPTEQNRFLVSVERFLNLSPKISPALPSPSIRRDRVRQHDSGIFDWPISGPASRVLRSHRR